MSKKIIQILFLCFLMSGFAQQSSVVATDTIPYHTFKPKFQEKYSGNDFNYTEKIPETTSWQRFIDKVGRFLDNLFQFAPKGKVTAFEVFVKIMAILIILVVIYLIIKAILKKEGNWIFGKNNRTITAEEVSEKDIHTLDFEKLIQKYSSENNYRAATRFYFLWLLKKLSDAQQINWETEKTNSDYYYELKKPEIQQNFKQLSYIYEYVWYGEFDIEKQTFSTIEQQFLQVFKMI